MVDNEAEAEVTILGLGLMGRAIAAALLRAGRSTTVWNRTPGRDGDLITQGARVAPSAAAALSATDGLVIVCLKDHEAVRSVLDPLGEALSGRTVVNLTSSTSDQARELAAWVGDRGAAYLDGAIMAVPETMGGPEAVLLHSGDEQVFDQHLPVLRDLGTCLHLGTDPGLAALHDVALLNIMWGVLNSFLHGAALVGTAKVPAAEFAVLANQWISSVTDFVSAYAEQIDADAPVARDATLDTHAAAMDHLVQESEAAGVDVSLPRFFRGLVAETVANGRGGDSYAAVVDRFRPRP
ncbi:NAD(P)-dependent oxidoreductase [Streptomyces sp. NBC_00572]|uniref:NAD(P)-dependent oxidoreductase n=1 Tax=Streptomyces sp. NBC_00572 TaxID=2903664 RepID=UPI00224F6A2E|nr:NAD(P)-binding domain-containing protein [Streptomyces sp. NBC_00572]MCX4987084.1 NAD(P)-binding domain-containing protein [Streptomyces sp. NBC_00572]